MFGKKKEKITEKPDTPPSFYERVSGEFASESTTRLANEIHETNRLLKEVLKELHNFSKDIYMNPDGTKVFLLGDAGNDVNEYSMSPKVNKD